MAGVLALLALAASTLGHWGMALAWALVLFALGLAGLAFLVMRSSEGLRDRAWASLVCFLAGGAMLAHAGYRDSRLLREPFWCAVAMGYALGVLFALGCILRRPQAR